MGLRSQPARELCNQQFGLQCGRLHSPTCMVKRLAVSPTVIAAMASALPIKAEAPFTGIVDERHVSWSCGVGVRKEDSLCYTHAMLLWTSGEGRSVLLKRQEPIFLQLGTGSQCALVVECYPVFSIMQLPQLPKWANFGDNGDAEHASVALNFYPHPLRGHERLTNSATEAWKKKA
ncbi:hypothetical protein TcWFU_002161 [Taenia crassiceps]|uniref:Uncharacterized protein n=1 Tax=Taenia crassiceps TaxID=6207 RepID=A0ABR4Q4W4_9CEST